MSPLPQANALPLTMADRKAHATLTASAGDLADFFLDAVERIEDFTDAGPA